MMNDNWIYIAQEIAKQYIKVKEENNKLKIFDPIRSKWVALTKEEQIRQLLLVFLIHHLKISISKIGVEKTFQIDGENKRFDVVVFDKVFNPEILIEIKNEEQNVFLDINIGQLINYQRVIKAKGLLITNGNTTFGYTFRNEEWVIKKRLEEFF